MIAAPKAESRGFLWVAVLTGRDQVADFTAYVQTDGQRGRLVREWAKDFKGRQVPADWARARIRWAREQTLSSGFSVPNQLDDMLVHLGPAPPRAPQELPRRPAPAGFKGERDNVEGPLMAARAFAVAAAVRRRADPQEGQRRPPQHERRDPRGRALRRPDDRRRRRRARCARPCKAGRQPARGRPTNLWLNGHDEPAAELLALATELRSSPAPRPCRGSAACSASRSPAPWRIQRQQQQQQQRQAG
jgi:hypothetical protein